MRSLLKASVWERIGIALIVLIPMTIILILILYSK